MAGIGFRLRALISTGSPLEKVTAYFSSAVLSTGPWLSGVIALIVLSDTSATYLAPDDHALLLATIIWIFALSLLVAGGPQMLLTRYLADCLYRDERSSIAPTCTGVLFLNLPCALLAGPFLLFAPFSLLYRLLVITLYLTLTMTWLVTIFLSAVRAYSRIVLIYIVSYTCGAIASLLFGYVYGLEGSLAGFLSGELLCLSLLLGSVYREFPATRVLNWDYLRYFRRYWDMLLIGVLYALGSWISSLLFWLSPEGVTIHHVYRLFPPYDTARFVVYLSTIPIVALFMIYLETDFYRHYSNFYHLILHKGNLEELICARQGMIAAVRRAVRAILTVQGMIVLLFWLCAVQIAAFLGLEPRWVLLLRVEIAAGPGQFLFFTMVLFLLYLDQRRSVLLLLLLFLLSNAGLTLISLFLGSLFYGLGDLISGWVGTLLGWYFLQAHLKQLEYRTFMAQPID